MLTKNKEGRLTIMTEEGGGRGKWRRMKKGNGSWGRDENRIRGRGHDLEWRQEGVEGQGRCVSYRDGIGGGREGRRSGKRKINSGRNIDVGRRASTRTAHTHTHKHTQIQTHRGIQRSALEQCNVHCVQQSIACIPAWECAEKNDDGKSFGWCQACGWREGGGDRKGPSNGNATVIGSFKRRLSANRSISIRPKRRSIIWRIRSPWESHGQTDGQTDGRTDGTPQHPV